MAFIDEGQYRQYNLQLTTSHGGLWWQCHLLLAALEKSCLFEINRIFASFIVSFFFMSQLYPRSCLPSFESISFRNRSALIGFVSLPIGFLFATQIVSGCFCLDIFRLTFKRKVWRGFDHYHFPCWIFNLYYSVIGVDLSNRFIVQFVSVKRLGHTWKFSLASLPFLHISPLSHCLIWGNSQYGKQWKATGNEPHSLYCIWKLHQSFRRLNIQASTINSR